MSYQFNHIVLGGTFDVLHNGHKNLISIAFKISNFVSIGITSDFLNKNRGKITYENQEQRKNNLIEFLNEHKFTNRADSVFINDIFGSSLKKEIEAIIVTEKTKSNAHIINKEREKQGLNKLKIIETKLTKADDGKFISSTRIRNGNISPEGVVYKKVIYKVTGKKLEQKFLRRFKNPLGKIVLAAANSGKVITVGDMTTHRILNEKMRPFLSVVDLKTKRKFIFKNISEIGLEKPPNYKLTNRKSTLSKKLVNAIDRIIKLNQESVILIKGEEDLALIPCVLLSSYGTRVYYGQPNAGMVEIVVNKESKNKILKLLS